MAKPLEEMFGGDKGEASSPKEEAAQDLIDAIKAGDAKAASLALEAHYELCAAAHDSEPDEDDEEETYGG